MLFRINYFLEKEQDLDKALNYYIDSKKIYEQIGNLNGVAACLNNIGNIYDNKNDFNNALNNCLNSKRIYQQIGNIGGVATCKNNLGNIYKNSDKIIFLWTVYVYPICFT